MYSPSTRTVRFVVALLALGLLAQPITVTAAATGPAAGSTVSAGQTAACDAPDSSSVDDDEYAYVDELDNFSTADWSGGQVVRFGAHGDCSLAVLDGGTATLQAATVDTRAGVLVATLDLARGGTFRVGAPAGATDSAAAVTIENVGPDYSDRLAVVVRNGTNVTTHRTQLTAPSGRFVDVALRFRPDGTVAVTVWDTEERRPDDPDVTANVPTDEGNWTVSLTAQSYLDELAIGTTATPTPSPGDGTETGADDGESDDVFDHVDEYEEAAGPGGDDRGGSGGDGTEGLVMGPFLVVVGALSYYFAYPLSRLSEQLDAIGSKTRWSEVEPAEWKVWLTKVMAVGIVVAGLGWFSTAL